MASMPYSRVLADGSPEGKVGGNQCLPQGFLLMDHQKERSEESNAFLEVFNLRKDYIFNDAEYQACNSRLAKLRRPEQLPKRDDLYLFKTFVSSQLLKFMGDPYHRGSTLNIPANFTPLICCKMIVT